MKLLNLDWHEVFDLLPKWEALPVEQRRFLIDRSVAGYGSRTGDEKLIDLGWLEPVRTKTVIRYRVPERRRFWLKLLRIMSRATPFPDEAPAGDIAATLVLQDYLAQHYTGDEVSRLGRRRPHSNRYQLACDMVRVEWWREFLDWDDEADSAAPVGPREALGAHGRWQQAPPTAVTTAQELIDTVVAYGEPVAITDLLKTSGGSSDRADLAAGLDFAFREALLLIAVDAAMVPFVCIWPPILHRLQRDSEPSPREATFRSDELLDRPFLIEDISTVLLEAIAEPPRLKSGTSQLFVRNLRAIGGALPALPAWIAPEFAPLNPERRLARAVQFAISLRLATPQENPGTNRRLVVTDDGRRWLARPAKERLKQILDLLREDAMLRPEESRGILDSWYAEDPEAVPLNFVPYVDGLGWFFTSPDRGVVDAFRAVGRDSILDLRGFILFHAEERNPLLTLDTFIGYDHFVGDDGRDDVERIWGSTLLAFFHERLLPLGGVALGPLAEGNAGFRMTEIGRYLLGEADDFDLDTPEDTGDVVVQPNFEIVFLSPSPIQQVRARAFAAPTAALKSPESVGTLFVIDRASVQRAVMAGQDAEQVIAGAGDLSKQPLPANVTRQMRDWAAEVRWIDVRPAVLVDCGDAETAARVLSAVGKRGRLLSEGVVELADGTDLTPAMRRKLVSRGVFVRS